MDTCLFFLVIIISVGRSVALTIKRKIDNKLVVKPVYPKKINATLTKVIQFFLLDIFQIRETGVKLKLRFISKNSVEILLS